MVSAARWAMAAITTTAAVVSCAEHEPRYSVVHHRANGCDPEAPENSLMAARCVVRRCAERTAPCAFEGDAQLVRMRGGSLEGDLEVAWLHDSSTARTANCPGGDLPMPGDAPIDPARLEACRLYDPSGEPTAETIPILDEIIEVVKDSANPRVTLYLELKASGDDALDRTLAEAAVRKLRPIRDHVVVASFSLVALGRVRELDSSVPTACFVPNGSLGRHIVRRLTGGIPADVDQCLERGHDYVFVPPEFLDGSISAHVVTADKKLGVYGSDTADAYDSIRRWAHRIDVVYADHPAMYARSP
jgi:glycerophosphoryl diester phosphodiesterase